MACRFATAGADGEPLGTVVPFECACIPSQDDCFAMCSQLFGYGDALSCDKNVDSSGTQVLCGCAIVYLR
jgi:hypothetical protein